MTRHAAWVLRLYPRGWRRRYGDELAELTEELVAARETSASRAALDLVLSATVARWRILRRRLQPITHEAPAGPARDHRGAQMGRRALAAACAALVAFSIVVGLEYSHQQTRVQQLSSQLAAARQDEARADSLAAKDASRTQMTLACAALPPSLVLLAPGNGPASTVTVVPAPPPTFGVSGKPSSFSISSAVPIVLSGGEAPSGNTATWSSTTPCS